MKDATLEEKMNYIKDLNNESCKYLYNIYSKYLLLKSDMDINRILIENKCFFKAKTDRIIKICSKNNLALIDISNNNVKYDKLCKEHNIQFFKLPHDYKKIINLLKQNKINGVFIDIDIDSIEKWYNWDVFIENNFKEMLNKIKNTEFEYLMTDTETIVEKIITGSSKKYPFNSKNIISIAKCIDKILKYSNYNGIFANIYSNRKMDNKYYIIELSELLNCLTYKTNTARYEYIYDILCNKLEEDIKKYNYCLFEKDKCIAQRQKQDWPKTEYNGCCYNVSKKIECEHLKGKVCDTKCISCRLFTCKYLKDRGINYNIKTNILAIYFLNLIQRPELVWNFFTPKEKILKCIKRYKIKK